MSRDGTIHIDGRAIGPGQPPYVIAEISANHDGSIDNAIAIIDAAKAAGADAVKLQTYKPDTITIDHDGPEFRIEGGLWHGRTLYDLYEQAHMPWEWHKPLFAHARAVGITLFSTPFDDTAVELLESLDAPAYKIASFEVVDLPLIKRVARCGKPMILSTGMANEHEIAAAVSAAREGGCEALVLLHCVSSYPAQATDCNLRTLVDMRERFDVLTGLSDHTIDNATAVAAVALGAHLIEKHVTLDRQGGGPDDSFSLEPQDLASLCAMAGVAWQSLGSVSYKRTESEQGNVVFRRSLYVVKDVRAGELLSADNVRSIRPGYGLSPARFEEILGCTAAQDLARGTALAIEHLEPRK